MRRILFFIMFALTSSTLLGQNETDAVVKAFKSANTEEIASHFDEFVNVKLLDKDEVKNMSKNQASIALKTFFAENGIKGFDKVSDGGRASLYYLIGRLTNGNKGYNITIQLKPRDGKLEIITIRIS
jgi:hypothetical protein